jgi:hypothetical protein
MVRFRVVAADRPSGHNPNVSVRRWFRRTRRGLRRVRWSEGYEDRWLRRIVDAIDLNGPGQRTSRPLADVLDDLTLDDISRRGERFVLRSGRVLTDADRERMADEAERGHDPATLTPRVIRREWAEASREIAQPDRAILDALADV